jgi:hypothetical protein
MAFGKVVKIDLYAEIDSYSSNNAMPQQIPFLAGLSNSDKEIERLKKPPNQFSPNKLRLNRAV